MAGLEFSGAAVSSKCPVNSPTTEMFYRCAVQGSNRLWQVIT